jgi:hypothetical protein
MKIGIAIGLALMVMGAVHFDLPEVGAMAVVFFLFASTIKN